MDRDQEYKSIELGAEQKRLMLPSLRLASKQIPAIDFERLCFEPSALDEPTFEVILTLLEGPILRQHKLKRVACWILVVSPLTYQQRETACTKLGHLITRRKLRGVDKWPNKPGRIYFFVACAFLVSLFGSFALLGISAVQFEVFAVGFVLCLLTAVYEARLRLAVIAEANSAIGRLRVRESVDILAGAWWRNTDNKTPIASLHYALAALGDEDYGQMAADTVPGILRLLNGYSWKVASKKPSDERVMNLLTAIGKVGDGRALESVRRIAKNARETTAVRETAVRVLSILEERARQEEAPQVLLRGSEMSGGEDSLLRSAETSADRGEPAELVRAVEAGEECLE